ncbi:arsenate reductase/protein-tyrosine-phosphatase family protein [Aestuariimicrobium sp. T2.26MG-19.2B]|uniref:arsenate reductase/protein-tyrosine-phosphatase family protein n=1 Tax=Aestuariimicrobium sp. T2.26MG-19.2B TaxID=3040679 RepID=UPI002477BB9F|nr:low molecular weight phosphotyrosine protein phosphatase [Aestuariimicrobium sp. T2.26MG-19.2B]CAI9410689.1 putative low molecular weight protein-tyrosine-phosphatase [Aestuariimicrobium sp. T2.26MG-19.2B]
MAELLFVCWGNICRSPMGEVIARNWARHQRIDVDVASAGVSREEEGRPMDRRAREALVEHGFDVGGTRPARLVSQDIFSAARLVVAAEASHARRMERLSKASPDVSVRLVSDFIPGAVSGSALDDPWYGDLDDFRDTRAALIDAMPGVFAELDALRAAGISRR